MVMTVDQALEQINQATLPLHPVPAAPSDAHGRVLAQALHMSHDSPPFDRALVDGFAVRSHDARAGASLRIIGRQDAGGATWQGALQPGTCIAINTGAILPPQADGVLMVEQSETKDDTMIVRREVRPGEGIQRRGSQGLSGAVALHAGQRLSASAIAAGVMAGAGLFHVRRAPRIAVLSTGDELVPPGAPLAPGQIHNSNQPMLLALVREAGESPIDLGACKDQPDPLRDTLTRALAENDLLLITGGMSMGTRDLVPPLLLELGVTLHVEKVRMKPGKPFLFGTLGQGDSKKYVAGLPGNPVSAFVTFHIFVREILKRLSGLATPQRWISAELSAPCEPNGDREFFHPCTLDRRGPTLVAHPLPWRGSGDIFTLANANALLRRPPHAPSLDVGQTAPVLLL